MNSNNITATKAVLFDIDGTILNCHSAGKMSLLEATKHVYGTTGNMDSVNFQGKTDPLILFESLEDNGFTREEILERVHLLKENYLRLLGKKILEHRCTIMPGIESLLPDLAARRDLILGLLTGNFEEGARIKMGRFNLNGYFSMGAYGDDSHLRNELPAVARRKIRDMFDIDINFGRMVIIGDTVFDIRCARHAGAISVAVGTGWVDREVLLAEKPDYYFDDLGNTGEILKIINEL